MGLRWISLFIFTLSLCALRAAAFTPVPPVTTFSFPDAGWQVSCSDPTANLGVVEDGTGTSSDGQKFIALEIMKDFHSDGPIDLTFTQIGTASATAPRLIIEDETINNFTGSDWHEFEWSLTGTGVQFNETLTNAGGVNGFSIDPFTQVNWVNTQKLQALGGAVAANDVFMPGFGTGDLVIDATPGAAAPASFVFSQTPYAPSRPHWRSWQWARRRFCGGRGCRL